MDQISDPKELAALDAIIAASLAGRSIEDVPDDELIRRLEASPELISEASDILEGLGDAPFTNTLNLSTTGHALDQPAGMYRLGSNHSLNPSLKAEMEQKREQIRKRIKAARRD